jgi:hypothetical protein
MLWNFHVLNFFTSDRVYRFVNEYQLVVVIDDNFVDDHHEVEYDVVDDVYVDLNYHHDDDVDVDQVNVIEIDHHEMIYEDKTKSI